MSLSESQAREAICRVGASLFARGYVHATAGNISVRLEDGFLITPTDACLGHLDPARLAKVDTQGLQISGDKASKTLELHRQIYRAAREHDPHTACVIHTHSTHCVALSLLHPTAGQGGTELLSALTPYFVMKVGHVPHLPYLRPGDPEMASRVVAAISHYAQSHTPIRAVMLERLGPTVWHDHPDAAMAVLEELEETARLATLCPHTPPLEEPQLQELRDVFGARW